MKREIEKASKEHEINFRKSWKLRKDLADNPVWIIAYEYAATHKLYPDEISAIGEAIVEKE